MSDHYMKKPCPDCPFRHDVKPFLTAARGEELADHTQNPFNSFPCHKTTYLDDEHGEHAEGESNKECAGFLTMQISANGERFKPEGFIPAYDLVYQDSWEMTEAYEEACEEACE